MDKKNKKVLYRIICTCVLFIVAILLGKLTPSIYNITFLNINIELLIYIFIYLIIGYDIILKAVKNIFSGHLLDENFLMTIASVTAFFVSEYSEAIAVMLLYQIGELFQRIAVDKSRKSIADLMDICPEYANVLTGENLSDYEEIDSDEVEIGSKIIIKVGERVPLDCRIIKGETLLDTSALTGESVPISVKEGDELLSGSINTSNVIIAETIREYDDSTATKILELVENASDRKAKSEYFITKFAKYYTPIVVGMAAILVLFPPLFLGGNWGTWINRACILLITSCPCALVISVPLTFFGGIGKASRKGILIKGSNYLEELARVNTMVFDKTGTLTEGDFKVCKISPIGCSEDELLSMCVVAEMHSNHPIAKAVLNYYANRNNDNNNINDDSNNVENSFIDSIVDKIGNNNWNIEEIAGRGIVASKTNSYIYVGNDKLMKDNDIEGFNEVDELGTIIYIAEDNKYRGYIVISDEIKESSKKLIDLLAQNDIKKTIMLTGDKASIGEKIADKLGLSEVYAELLPGDKVDKLEKIIENNQDNSTVVYVGDGINDAPVLARADIGISMGRIASDVAIEASDIVLMDDNLMKIVDAIKISRVSMKVVRQNIVFALGIKFIVLVLGVLGLANMWLAIFADVGVLIIAILNAIFGIRYK